MSPLLRQEPEQTMKIIVANDPWAVPTVGHGYTLQMLFRNGGIPVHRRNSVDHSTLTVSYRSRAELTVIMRILKKHEKECPNEHIVRIK